MRLSCVVRITKKVLILLKKLPVQQLLLEVYRKMTVVDWNDWRSRTKHNTEQLSELGDTNRFFLGCPYIVKAVSSLHTDQNINDSTSRLNNGLSWFQKLCRKSAEEHKFLSQSPCPFAPAGLYYLIHKVYNRFDSRNVPLLEDIGTFFGYSLLSKPKPGELSVLRDGWPSHGPVDFRARPSWVWAGKLNIPERLQTKLLDYEKDLKKYGSDLEILNPLSLRILKLSRTVISS